MNFNIIDNKKKVKSLKKRLMISITSIVILSIICLSIILIAITTKALKVSVIEGFVASSKGVEKTINYMTSDEQGKLEYFKNNKAVLDFLTNNLGVERVNDLLINDNENNENSFETYIIDKNGIVVASNLQSSIGTDVSQREYFVEVKKNKSVYTSNVLVSITTGKTMITVAQPIISGDGEFLGVVGRDINTTYYREVLGDFVKGSSSIFIIDNNKKILYNDDDSLIGKENNIPAINEVLSDKNNKTGIIEYKVDGEKMMSTYTTLDKFGWKIFCTGEERVLFQAVAKMKLMTIGVLLIIIIIALITTIHYAKSTINPIMELVDKLKLISKGDFTVRVDSLKTGSEIDLLLNNFNNMMNDLQILLLTIESGFDEVKEECDKIDTLSKEIGEENLSNHKFIEELIIDNMNVNNVLGNAISDIDKVISLNSELLDKSIINDEIAEQLAFLRNNITSMMIKVLNINKYISDDFINLKTYMKNNNLMNDDLVNYYNRISNLISMEKSQVENINDLFTKLNELNSSIENSKVSNIKREISFINDININLKNNIIEAREEEERVIEISSKMDDISKNRERSTNEYRKIISNLKKLSSTTQSLIRIFKVKN